MDQQQWSLELGGETIASFLATGYEFPWTYARLVESSEFERYRQYFSDEDFWPETVEFEALCREIRDKGKFTLRCITSGEVHTSFRLNQEGECVWFRYS